ncbi:hypothetical protein [Paenibacillus sp. BSR1-1]|uniref:hypothetical protein n=1 Tax=Paenibacillus sp. BSR1-1 TaxID=3020845 RepID=UPI00339D6582
MWLRDVTIQNLNIDDNGQMYDVWIYLTYLAAHTKDIALGTASVGFSNQSIEWIAQNGDGWIQYPRIIPQQTQLNNEYRELSEIHAPGVFKPFTQTLFIDLSENPDSLPVPIP